MTLQLAPIQNDDILREHLGYSLDLVAMALREAAAPPHKDDPLREWFRKMSVIEVFWSQARLLIEFFNGSLASSTTSAADHFTRTKQHYDFAFGGKDVGAMMSNQIAHMNTARTTDPDAKLQMDDMWRVGGAIDRAVKKFEENLTDDALKLWKKRRSGFQAIDPNQLYVTRTLDACTAAPQIERSNFSSSAPEYRFVGTGKPSQLKR